MSARPSLKLCLCVTALAASLVLPVSALANNDYTSPGGNPAHWSDRNGAIAYVYIVDRTGPSWPVFAAAVHWNTNGENVITYQSPGSCDFHCVDVRVVDDLGPCSGPVFVRGEFKDHYSGFGHLTSDSRVKFNVNCSGYNSSQKGELTCHEVGHAVGIIGHRGGGCMREGDNFCNDGCTQSGTTHDFSMFSQIYGHND